MDSQIEHISDTARWVAVYRAMESERPDAHFRDPYARRLAGERGEAIVRGLRRGRQSAWAMIVRTKVLDDLIVQVDLPGILDYKAAQLAAESPRCQLERIATDLTDLDARRALFARVGAGARRALVITEGLLAYLDREQVASLATDLHAPLSFGTWLTDIVSPRILKLLQRQLGNELGGAGAQMKFGPPEGADFFRPYGWTVVEATSMLEAARRLRREFPLAWFWRATLLTERQRAEWKRLSQILELARA
ncbi:MAG TPA: class I SAM-dependent methyltransferase [Gemmatimonadales bacterium]|nr:class I SAM-dependent methyltransferase [Gemmatimonadales bacterium]